MRKHPILNQLYGMELKEKEIGIVWLGQNGFLIKSRHCVFFFDPYLSDFAEQWTYGWKNEHVRMSAIPIQPKELYGIDYVLCTHDHVDHIDPFTIPIIALRNPETKFVSPKATKQRMESLFVDESNLFLLKGEDSIELPEIKIHAIPAAHSKLASDKENGFHFLSYIVEVDGVTIFHAGDTVPYEGQTDYFKDFSIDIALLPINGYQPPELEFEPNFSIKEAIDFAKEIKAKKVIPMHYDMYTLNTANIADFVTQAEENINYTIAQNGIPFKLVL
jgi:L-ascorbate metabolism protein UlaG (beta-lactamase superfamily)